MFVALLYACVLSFARCDTLVLHYAKYRKKLNQTIFERTEQKKYCV